MFLFPSFSKTGHHVHSMLVQFLFRMSCFPWLSTFSHVLPCFFHVVSMFFPGCSLVFSMSFPYVFSICFVHICPCFIPTDFAPVLPQSATKRQVSRPLGGWRRTRACGGGLGAAFALDGAQTSGETWKMLRSRSEVR